MILLPGNRRVLVIAVMALCFARCATAQAGTAVPDPRPEADVAPAAQLPSSPVAALATPPAPVTLPSPASPVVAPAAAGLPANFAAMWQSNHALFPRGVDLVLCAGATVTALPRSVSIEGA